MKVNYWKVGVFAAAAIGLFAIGRSCGVKSVIKTTGSDTTIRKDSIVYVNKPVPYKVDSFIFVRGNDGKPYPVHDTLETFEVRIDTVPGGCNDVAYYKDVRDTGRVKLTILDTVSMNRLQGRSVNIVFTDTTIKETVVLKPPQKLILFFGVSAVGSRKNPFHLAGIDLTLKAVNDRQYVIGANVDKDGKLYGELGLKWPIRFK